MLYNFNSRTSYKVRRRTSASCRDSVDFNSRTSYKVRRQAGRGLLAAKDFNSRTSYKVRQEASTAFSGSTKISIHAPHTRCDVKALKDTFNSSAISIHAPHTRCDWSATLAAAGLEISIHAPHTRCDKKLVVANSIKINFNSRTSYKVRHLASSPTRIVECISIHAPHTRCDSTSLRN